MKKIFLIHCMALLICVFLAAAAHSRPRATVKYQTIRTENKNQKGREALVLPYAFSSETMGTAVGLGGGIKGLYQDQLLIAGTVFGGADEDTYGIILGAWDYRPFPSDRFYLSAVGSYGHYPRQRIYGQSINKPGDIRPGSNDSEQDDYIEAGGENNWSDFKLEYVLPIGAMSGKGMTVYELRGGLIQEGATGGDNWNPLTGGVTTLMLRQYNQFESFKTEYGTYERPIHPIEIGIGFNNTDFPPNPSTGSNQYLGLKHDFGWGEATDWTFLEFETSKFFSLGTSDTAKQRVIALNMWTGEALSWNEKISEDGLVEITGNPPQYDGATLGGFYRMRAYPTSRFHDRSVLYTTAEYRYTPYWNPLNEVSFLHWLQSSWIQVVGFVEAGRVANEYNELFDEWKTDAGIGLRSMMAGGVVRFDWTVSDEGYGINVMLNHPF